MKSQSIFRSLAGPSSPAAVRGRFGLAVGVCLTGAALTRPAAAKTFIDYIQRTPITCPLTSNTWGVQGVLPRDTCNGIESPHVPPAYYYWDGKIIRAPDGAYHMFADRWPGSTGFGNWVDSDPIHAVSTAGPLGPYMDQGYAYGNAGQPPGPGGAGDPHKGHNVMACALLDGTYCLVVSEIVPFTVFTSQSLDGPWTACSNPTGELIEKNGVNAGSDGHLDSNVSILPRPDGNFEIVQRHGLIGLSTTGICGPYKLQNPTNTYPSNEQPPFASIYPNRQMHLDPMAPEPPESTYTLAEDPVIWYSGGLYHVIYDYPDDRVGYHLTSPDGIHDWTDGGLAYDPRDAKQIFSYTDGTVTNWYKMERPNVLLENGHVTHVTWAVSDVDKNYAIPAGSNHGSKVVVVPFDGVGLDCDMSDAGCAAPEDGGVEGGADGGADGAVHDGGSGEHDGGSGEEDASAGSTSSSGSLSSGGLGGGSSSVSGGGGSSNGGSSSNGGAAPVNGHSAGGCGCLIGAGAPVGGPSGGLLAVFGAWLWMRGRRRAGGSRAS